MRLAREADAERAVHYRYHNLGPAGVDLFLARPPECSTQDRPRVVACSAEPEEVSRAGGNEVARFRLGAGRTLRLCWVFHPVRVRLTEGEPESPLRLGAAERGLYLEPSPQVPRHPEIEARARELAAGGDDPLSTARWLFGAVARAGRYVHPVRRRGALEMLRQGRGDCGQLSSLLVALCRARGIPARLLVGTWVAPRIDSGHSWVEIWVEGLGWVPADPSLGNAYAEARRRGIAAPDPEDAFGRYGGATLAFSIGFDVPLAGFGDPVRPLTLPALLARRVTYGGRPLRWGFDTLDGRAPYLQPAYPRSYTGGGAGALFRCSAAGHWGVEERRLAWTALPDALEQGWPALALLLAIAGWLLPARPQWPADLLVAATVLLVVGAATIKGALRGASPRRLAAAAGAAAPPPIVTEEVGTGDAQHPR